jgi:phosphatidylserine decarboxylase
MTDETTSISRKTFPWFRSGFDLEGIVGFLAAWLLAVLLGMVWEPLFWLAFIPGVFILFATRTAERVTAQTEEHLVAPCDGVVVSVEDVDAPEALRLTGPTIRIRISSSPFSANNVHAPVAGAIERIERIEGEPKAVAAMRPDLPGLEHLFASFSGQGARVGLDMAVGGLGPRLNVKTDAGDRVRKGKTFATRRLGGWCDVYIDKELAGGAIVQPGRALIGGETVLWDTHMNASSMVSRSMPERQSEETADEAGKPPLVSPETLPPQMANDGHVTPQPEPAADSTMEEQGVTPDVTPANVSETAEAQAAPAPDNRDAPASPDTVPPEVADDAEPKVEGKVDELQPEDTADEAGKPPLVSPETLPPQMADDGHVTPQPEPAADSTMEEQGVTPDVTPANVSETAEAQAAPAPDNQEAPASPDTVPPEVAEEAEPKVEKAKVPNNLGSMFERLRREARKLSGEDDGSER